MSPAALKLAVQLGLALLLVLLSAGATWQVQDWRYGQQLAAQAGLHQDDLTAIGNAAAAQVRADQDQRRALEQRLAATDQSHYQELSHANTLQARLRDRLATADLRLSVLIAAPAARAGGPVSATPGAGGVVHAAARAELDPAAAQRIVAIAADGDAGLIALAACQAYARELSTPRPAGTGVQPLGARGG
jgi:hypothetical protein